MGAVNYPPMNELVFDGINGSLVNNFSKQLVTNIRDQSAYQNYAVYPDVDDLASKIIYCIKNKNIIQDQSWTQRKLFFLDMIFFEKTMNHLIDAKIIPKLI